MAKQTIKYINKKYGRLTVLNFEYKKNKRHYYLCSCECGNTKIIAIEDIRIGDSLSCGCIHKENLIKKMKKHGESKTRLYKIWCGIRKRCFNKNAGNYNRYGGRGIKICDEWSDYNNFKNWALENGYEENLTIDRINNNGNYKPENCRWVTQETQSNNRVTNHYITYKGQTKSMSEWCKTLDLNYSKIRSRINYYKWSIEKAFETK